MKNVLVIYYSQSGQLKEIADQISLPFRKDEQVKVDFLPIEMQRSFPFPWDNDSFFGAFPETFQQIPSERIPPNEAIFQTIYDLVLFHYLVLYLTHVFPIYF